MPEYEKWYPGLNILIPDIRRACPKCSKYFDPRYARPLSDPHFHWGEEDELVVMEEAEEDMGWDDEREEAIWALDDEYHLSGQHNVHQSRCSPKVTKRQMQCGHRY